jgi:hypothetical protein
MHNLNDSYFYLYRLVTEFCHKVYKLIVKRIKIDKSKDSKHDNLD